MKKNNKLNGKETIWIYKVILANNSLEEKTLEQLRTNINHNNSERKK